MKQVKGNKKSIVSCITILILLTFMANGVSAHHPKKSTRQFDVGPLSSIDNPQAKFKIVLWTDRENATYRIGEKVTFFFKADKDCRVTLLNVGADGKVQILFPNEYHMDNQVKAGIVYAIPPKEARFAIRAKTPAGEDTLKAIATLDKVDLIQDEDIIPVKGFIRGFKGVNKNIKILTLELEETLRPVAPLKWAETEKVIKVIP